MSDTVIIALIIAAVIVIALIIFRKQLSEFIFKAGKEGVEAQLKTHEPGGSGHAATPKPAGPSQSVTANDQAEVADIRQKMADATPGMEQRVAAEGQAQISGVTQEMKAAGPKAKQSVQAKDDARVKDVKQEM